MYMIIIMYIVENCVSLHSYSHILFQNDNKQFIVIHLYTYVITSTLNIHY